MAATLDELRKVKDPAGRALAAAAYIKTGEAKIGEARQLRDRAILELVDSVGVTATARACAVSVTHVKAIRKASR